MADTTYEDNQKRMADYYSNGTWRDTSMGRRFTPNAAPQSPAAPSMPSLGAGASAYTAGGGVAGGAGAAGGAGGPGATTNTAAADPNVNWLIDKYKDRFSQDNTNRAIDKSNAGIADSAALLQKDAQGSLAARGIRGTGAGAAFIQKNITAPAQRQAAGAAADIAMNNEKRLDALTLGGTQLMSTPAEIALRQQANANQQYATQAQAQVAAEQAAAQRAQMQWAQYQALASAL